MGDLAAPGGVGGGLLLYGNHACALRRGFAAWSALLPDNVEDGGGAAAPCSQPWRRMWGWIVSSLAVLVAGLALGVVGTTLVSGGGS